MEIWTLQKERSVITTGIVLCGAGVYCFVAGVVAWRAELRFQAVAHETTATVIRVDPPWRELRFETDQGPVEVRTRTRGFHEAVGTTLGICFDPADPYHWRRGPRPSPDHELILAGVGGGFILFGAALLVLGWFARQRSGRPYWL